MNFKFLPTKMDKLLSSCFLTWPMYLSSESAQKLTSRYGLQNSLVSTKSPLPKTERFRDLVGTGHGPVSKKLAVKKFHEVLDGKKDTSQ